MTPGRLRLSLLSLVLLSGLTGLAGCGGSKAGLPPFLCLSCGGDGDCGGNGNRCLDMSSGPACGVDCSASSCPSGFVCAGITGGGSNCIPSSGSCPTVQPCNGGCDPGWTCDMGTDTCVRIPDGGPPQQDSGPTQTDAPPPSTQ